MAATVLCYHLPICVLLADMSSWLSQLGYDYSRLVPAVTQLDPRRRLMSGLHTSPDISDSESVSTRSLVECALKRADTTARRLSIVRRSKVVAGPAGQASLPRALAPQPGIFGRGVVVSDGWDGRLSVSVVDGTDTERAVLAMTLFNASRSVGLPAFTVYGRDVHHFLHENLQRAGDDLRVLGLEPDLSARVAGLNMTIHRGVSHVEVRLHGDVTWVSVRYGATVRDLRGHLLRRAAGRAADAAWAVERERAQSGKRRVTGGAWTRRDLDELLSRGHVTGYRPVYVRDVVDRFPLLADDPYNIRFVPDR